MRRLSVPAAVALSLALAGQTLAATWQTPSPLSAPNTALAGGLVTLGSSTAVAVYAENNQVYRRRSIDSAMTWSGRYRLSSLGTNSGSPVIAGWGTDVDVVWQESDFPRSHIRYARSINGGRTFSASVALTRIDGRASSADVARGPNGRVAVVWHDIVADQVKLRVSTNGGVSFGTVRVISSAFAEEQQPVVAVGKGVIYAAYMFVDVGIRIRRSLDNGRTWSPPETVANNGAQLGLDMTANGSQAYIAYVARSEADIWVRYRRTADKGASWSSPRNLSPASGMDSTAVRVSLRGGVARAIFNRCLDAGCTSNAVFYRQSSTGIKWTSADQASHAGLPVTLAGGVGYAGRIIVLYTGYDSPVAQISKGTVFARAATP